MRELPLRGREVFQHRDHSRAHQVEEHSLLVLGYLQDVIYHALPQTTL